MRAAVGTKQMSGAVMSMSRGEAQSLRIMEALGAHIIADSSTETRFPTMTMTPRICVSRRRSGG